jgi:23S rRNA pseudouridine2457 synthase
VVGNLFSHLLTNPYIYKVPHLRDFFFELMFRYFIVYKPYKTLSQFTSALNKKTLADYFSVPKNVYPVGRLDEDSEGLLILTNDSKLNHHLLNPAFEHEREYWVQVEGEISDEAVMQMQQGLQLNIKGEKHITASSVVEVFSEAPQVAQRIPPVRYRANVATSWIKIILKEGKNRQVRKMTAAVGFPTLRLIRYRIEKIELNEMQPGTMIELSQKSIYKKLFHAGSL